MAIVDSLPSTEKIADPQVRHFCDALLNAWQLRNGVTGDGGQRFITAEEWNALAGNPVINALAGLANPGSNPALPGPGGGPGQPGLPGTPGAPGYGVGAVPPVTIGSLPPAAQALITLINEPITTNDFVRIRQNANEIFVAAHAAQQLVEEIAAGGSTLVSEQIKELQDGITAINSPDDPSTPSFNAQTLRGVKGTVEDPVTGVEAAHAGIFDINQVDIPNGRSASATKVSGMEAVIKDPNTGLVKAHADIAWINTVSATSESYSAKQLFTMSGKTENNNAQIVQLNTLDGSSTSPNAIMLTGMNLAITNPTSGLTAMQASIVATNTLSADPAKSSITARAVHTLNVDVYDEETGLIAHTAQIGEINRITADSESASARSLHSVQAFSKLKGRVFIQTQRPESTYSPPLSKGQEYELSVNDLWIDSGNGNMLKRWTGSDWVESSDARISGSGAGITTEREARSESDKALASSINTVWGYLSNDTALVQDGATISLVPGAGTAHKWNDLQVAVYDYSTTPAVPYTAKLREDYNLYVNKNEGRAAASWVLRANTEANGVKSVAGMGLYSEVNPQGPTSALVFQADGFYVFNDTINLDEHASKVAPFAIVNGIVRQNISYITDHIRSDSYSPGVSGWRISANGNAEFNGVLMAGTVRSGSKLIDRDSGQQLFSVAQAAHFNSYSGAQIHTSGELRFEGPGQHVGTAINRRIRTNTVGGPLIVTVMLSAEVDHYMTLWFRGWDRLNWYPATTIVTSADSYGTGCITWGSSFAVNYTGWFEFGFSPTNGALSPFDPGKVDMRNVNCVVQFCNL
jgi:hypothetical protein